MLWLEEVLLLGKSEEVGSVESGAEARVVPVESEAHVESDVDRITGSFAQLVG